ncbi:MAG: phosphotransferase [Phycisphaerales bacterium]
MSEAANRPADRGPVDAETLASAEAQAGFAVGEVHHVRVHYPIGQVLKAAPLNAGSPEAPKIVLVGSLCGPVVLKRLAPGRDGPEFVHVIHSIHRRLAAHGFPLAPLLPTRGGASALRLEGKAYEVCGFIRGGRCDRSPLQTRLAGEALGRYHALLANAHDHLGAMGRTIGEPLTGVYHDDVRIRRSLSRLPQALDAPGGDDLAARLGALYEKAAARARDALEGVGVQVVHGDWHPGNLLFHDGQLAAVLDHEAAGVAPAMLDIANGALQFSLQGSGTDFRQWPTPPDVDRLSSFMEGVHGGRAIIGVPGVGQQALGALPWLMAEALIAEATVPIAATGAFHGRDPAPFLRMVARKAQWLSDHAGDVLATAHP